VLHCLALGGFVGYAANGTRRHPTEKPVGLMRELIAKCPAGATADPFAGVGTTLIAAKQLGRRAVGVEVRADYCEAAARRLSQLTIFEAGAELAEAGGITP
jgi:site-specific DNA-methyltransferase (adenine-specific)